MLAAWFQAFSFSPGEQHSKQHTSAKWRLSGAASHLPHPPPPAPSTSKDKGKAVSRTLLHRMSSGKSDVEIGPINSNGYADVQTPAAAEESQRESLLSGTRNDDESGTASKTPDVESPTTRNGEAAPPPKGAPGSFEAKGPLAASLDSLSPRFKFMFLVGCVMLFFGLHNLLQEALFAMDGFNFGWSIGMLEATGVVAGSFLERWHSGDALKRVAPLHSYVMLSSLLAVSSIFSNIALKYIEYPTKVIFRSCKLIPTMVIAVLWRKKIVSRGEFIAAAAVCAGLVIFAQAESRIEPDFHPRGIILVLLSVCADAFLPNAQEHVFSTGASRAEVTFYSNSLTAGGILLSTAANGNLFPFLSYAVSSTSVIVHLAGYAVLAHVAIASHMMVVKEYGGVTAVLVGNTRKAMTIALSFLVFPKPFSYQYILGGALVLGGLAANVLIKERRKSSVSTRKSHLNLPGLDTEPKNGISGAEISGKPLAHHTRSASEAVEALKISGGGIVSDRQRYQQSLGQ